MRAIAPLFFTACMGSSALGTAIAQAALPAACHATSPAARATVIELYTSEGCSSCPPADRWAASLRDTPQRVLLAFHVDYWDRLGWKDRFASPAYTERQQALRLPSGGRFAYTPQVLVDGADWKHWPALPAAGDQAAPVRIELQREGTQVLARVSAAEGGVGPLQRFSGYWAVVEDGHRSQVQAGENAGSTLRHDHVVRRYQPVEAWPAGQVKEWRLGTAEQPAADGTAAAARRTVFVVTDPLTQRPLQAAWLGC